MTRVYVIFDENDNILVTNKNSSWTYKTLGAAKTAAKLYIKYINSKLEKQFRIKFEEYKIIEYELVEKVIHPL